MLGMFEKYQRYTPLRLRLHNCIICIMFGKLYLKARCCKKTAYRKAYSELLRRMASNNIIILCCVNYFYGCDSAFFGKPIWRQHFEKLLSASKTRAPFIDPPPPPLPRLRRYYTTVLGPCAMYDES